METCYYDEFGQECEKNDAYYYTAWQKGVTTGEVRSYYVSNGKLKSIQYCVNNKLSGDVKYFHPNQTLECAATYFNGKVHGLIEKFYPSGQLHIVERYDSMKLDARGKQVDFEVMQYFDSLGNHTVVDGNGEIQQFYKTRKGFKKFVGKIKNGVKDSIWHGYYETGGLYFTEIWLNGKLKSGESISEEGNKFIYGEVLEASKHPNELAGFYREVYGNIKYPNKARANGTEGTVKISFIVDKDGSIISPKVEMGIGSGCDEAAIKAFSRLTPWKPALFRGLPVKSRYIIAIIFKLR